MFVELISQNAAPILSDRVKKSVRENTGWGAIYFPFSGLGLHPTEGELLLLLRPLAVERKLSLYLFNDSDFMVTFGGAQKAITATIVEKIHSHFNLSLKEPLHLYFDSRAQADELEQICNKKKEPIKAISAPLEPIAFESNRISEFVLRPTPAHLEIFAVALRKRARRKQPEILIVEDQSFSTKLLLGMLERSYNVFTVPNAEDALEIYLSEAPDILFLDIELPGVTGHQLAAFLSELDPQAFIVMVTANHFVEDVTTAKANGAKGFIVKPYNKQKIMDSIQKFLRDKKQTT